MFLQWINQILGCLDSPLITVIGQLLIRISQIYPKAVQLPLRIFMEKEIYNYKQCEEFLKTKYVLLIIICILNKRKKKFHLPIIIETIIPALFCLQITF